MSLAWYGDITYAGELLPRARIDIEGPSVVVMIRSIRTAESNNGVSVSFNTTWQTWQTAMLIGGSADPKWEIFGKTETYMYRVSFSATVT